MVNKSRVRNFIMEDKLRLGYKMMKIITSKMRASIKILFIGIVLAGGWWIWSSQVYSEIQKEVSITTDKTEYKQGETVKIAIINGLTDEITIPYEGKELYGNFAKLEKKSQSGEWMKIELPWISTKLMGKILKPGGKHIYFWKHQITGDNYDIANPGTYRIKLSYYPKGNWRNGVIVYSNEFMIEFKGIITTDKIKYTAGEIVRVTILNKFPIPKDMYLRPAEYLFGNFTKLERKDQLGKWKEVKLLKAQKAEWLSLATSLNTGEEYTYLWNQRIEDGSIITSGIYRIGIYTSFELYSGIKEIFYSNEFKIKKKQNKVTITVNKIEYKEGETVEVVVKNNLNEPIFLESCNPVIIELKDEQNMWKELNRKFCFANLVKQQIKMGGDKVITEFDTGFEWEGVKFFPIGSYKLKFTYYLGCTKDCVKESVDESKYCIRCTIKKTSRYAAVEPIDKPIILGLQFCDKWETIYSEEFTIKQKSDIAIDIDKTEYKQGETVKITIRNNLDIPLRNYDMVTESTLFSNQYVGWGFIERFENGDWVKIEPLWRCGETCFATCKLSGNFFVLGAKGATKFPEDFRYFEWNQTRLICDPNLGRTIGREHIDSGKYRISSTFWDESKERDIKRIFYSDEFIVK